MALITTNLTVADLAGHAATASIGLVCQRQDKAALTSLALLSKTTPADLVSHHVTLVISQGLWDSNCQSEALLGVVNGMFGFLEGVLSEHSTAHAHRLDAVLREEGVMPFTQLEVIYAATEEKRWGLGPQPCCETVEFCNTLLTTLVTLESGSDGRPCALHKPTGRQLLPIETVEFFVQLLGGTLNRITSRHGRAPQGWASGKHERGTSRFLIASQVLH
jgi:hypothetical protein